MRRTIKMIFSFTIIAAFMLTSFLGESKKTFACSNDIVTINWNDIKQEIDGFGFSGAEWSTIAYGLPEDKREEVMDLLFLEDGGIGASICRSEIFPEYCPDKGVYNFEYGPEQLWYIKAAEERGVDKQIATVWTPPGWMKTNGQDEHGGYLKEENYQDFAELMSEFVRYFDEKNSIDFYAISMCNEPNAGTVLGWNSCSWDGKQIKNFIANYLKPTMENKGIQDTKVIAAEPSCWGELLVKQALNDPVARDRIDIVAAHQYQLFPRRLNNALSKGKKVWQTEVCDPGHFDASMDEGLRWAKNIHKFMVNADASAYLYWQGIMRLGSEGLICTDAEDPNKSTDYVITKRYYTFGHYSKFVRPGYVRIGTSGSAGLGTYVSAFKDPETGKYAIIVINDTDNTKTINIKADGFSSGYLTPYVTNENINMEKCNDIPYKNGNFEVTLYPKSVVTYVGEEGSELEIDDNEVTVVDDLDDWSKTYAHTSGWYLDSSNQDYFDGDSSRASRNSEKEESIIYHYDNITNFTIKVYEYRYFDNISIYASTDNENWTPIEFLASEGITTSSGWKRKIYEPVNVPKGTNYLKIVHGDNSTWQKQISKVVINYVVQQ